MLFIQMFTSTLNYGPPTPLAYKISLKTLCYIFGNETLISLTFILWNTLKKHWKLSIHCMIMKYAFIVGKIMHTMISSTVSFLFDNNCTDLKFLLNQKYFILARNAMVLNSAIT